VPLRFSKMHAAGNDFVVLDRRDGSALPDPALLARIAERHRGIGCDQVMVLVPARSPGAVAGYRVINADGSDARQCGNGVRCLAAWLHRAGALDGSGVLDGPTGPVPATVAGDGSVEVALDVPAFAPEAVPMAGAVAAGDGRWQLHVGGAPLRFGAVAIGNPHVVIEVDDVVAAPVHLAPLLQAHPAFPHGCNVGFAQVLAPDRIALRVVERGVGETLACGSGACAAQAWLRRAGKVAGHCAVDLPGGRLQVRWSGIDGAPVRLGGPAVFVFEGEFTP
jgi:diaminopimelate epimerase